MIRRGFRPWGQLHALLNNTLLTDWAFIGCASMEERSTAVVRDYRARLSTEDRLCFQIRDYPSRHQAAADLATQAHRQVFEACGFGNRHILEFQIDEKAGVLNQSIDEFIGKCRSGNLILDITSLPKRYFFLILKKVLKSPQFINILVTCGDPETYSEGKLAEGHLAWAALPGFNGPIREPEKKKLVIGLGFEPLGLPELYGTGLFTRSEVHFLLPFPASPEKHRRNWDFLRQLIPVPTGTDIIHRVDASNVPDSYLQIAKLTDNGATFAQLAPFGPKGISLAMCLYACMFVELDELPGVYYTQPTIYNSEYSKGIKVIDDIPSINAYAVKLAGANLYGRDRLDD